MGIKVYKILSFTDNKDGGNPAGVVFDADNFSEEIMKNIAFKVGASETAFVSKSEKADFKVRFFTPVEEVNLCGHATIATFFLMSEKGMINPGIYTQETKAGLLKIVCDDSGEIFMDQNIPVFYGIIDKKEIADALGITQENISGKYSPEIVSTGLKDIIIPVKSFEILNNLKPDYEKISQICRKNDSAGFHVFCTDRTGYDASCRNFAPHLGIKEEAATGTASGALAAYIIKNKIYNGKFSFTFEQGYAMKKPSVIKAVIQYNKSFERIQVGGRAFSESETEI